MGDKQKHGAKEGGRDEWETSRQKYSNMLQLARALLFHAYLPKLFWDHALLMATYILNRLPSSVLDRECLYEVLFSHSPNYDSLRCFGCLCFATNNKPHKDRFEPRASSYVFFGFQHGMKAYKLFNLFTNSVFFSRDVTFH